VQARDRRARGPRRRSNISTELTTLVQAGDARDLLHWLAALAPDARRALRAEAVAADNAAEWNRTDWDLREHQLAAAWVGLAATTSGARALRSRPPPADDQLVVDTIAALRPPWAQAYAEALLPMRFRLIRGLERAGLVRFEDRPDAWVLGLMDLGRRPTPEVMDELRADPELIQQGLPRLFEVEGGGEISMSNVAKFGAGWDAPLQMLVTDGHLRREDLLSWSLSPLEAGFSAYRASWYRRFHEVLGPTPSERVALRERYLGLLGCDVGPTVSFALHALEIVHGVAALPADQLANAILPAMLASSKRTALQAIALMQDTLRGCDDETQAALLPRLQDGLAHPDREVLNAWTGAFTSSWQRPRCKQALQQIAEAWRDQLDRDVLRSISREVAAALPPPAGVATPSPEAFEPTARARLPLEVPQDREALLKVWRRALAHPEQVLVVEAALAGAASLGAPGAEVLPERSGMPEALAQRPPTGLEDWLWVCALAESDRPETGWLRTGWVYNEGWRPSPDRAFLVRRLHGVALQLHRGLRLPLLSTPTHDDHAIDPRTLVERVARWVEANQPPDAADAVLALSRTGLEGRAEASARLREIVAAYDPEGGIFGVALGNRSVYRVIKAVLSALDPKDAATHLFGSDVLETAAADCAVRGGAAPPDLRYSDVPTPSLHGPAHPDAWDLQRRLPWEQPLETPADPLFLRIAAAATASQRPLGVCFDIDAWLPSLTPHEPELAGARTARLLSVLDGQGQQRAVERSLSTLAELCAPLGPWCASAVLMALADGRHEIQQVGAEVLDAAIVQGRITTADLGSTLHLVLRHQLRPPKRYAQPLLELAERAPRNREVVVELLGRALVGPREELHKDAPALLAVWKQVMEGTGRVELSEGNRVFLTSVGKRAAASAVAMELLGLA
jgi:hypothetical protein